MEEKKEVIKESVRNDMENIITSVLPQGSETGFFLVQKAVNKTRFDEPLMARKIIFEAMDGTVLEVTVNRTPPADTVQGIDQEESIRALEAARKERRTE